MIFDIEEKRVFIRGLSEHLQCDDTVTVKLCGDKLYKSDELLSIDGQSRYVVVEQWFQPSFGHGDWHVYMARKDGPIEFDVGHDYEPHVHFCVMPPRMDEISPNPLHWRGNINYGTTAERLEEWRQINEQWAQESIKRASTAV